MSIVVRFPPSNVTRQQYDSVRNALTESGDWPRDLARIHPDLLGPAWVGRIDDRTLLL